MSDRRERNSEDNRLDSTKSDNNLFVVGIGASAGGLAALEELFTHLPADSGAAFVVIQRSLPDFQSSIEELLDRYTDMAIHRVTEGMKLQPNSVYLTPPGQNLTLEANLLQLKEGKKDQHDQHKLNFPIDLFFTSLAKNYQERAIGVILSGSGSDGTDGLRAINEAGGITLVQDPETAEFEEMPHSAIATGVVNQILSPPELARLVYHCVVSTPGLLEVKSTENNLLTYSSLKTIVNFLLETENIDFSHYKTSTMSRRIHRRRLINNFNDVATYINFLRNSTQERKILCADLLINVTHFFRDRAAWESIETKILPILIEQTEPEEELRFWVAGCSTGEEAYSLAILVREALEYVDKPLTVKIFATDIDRTALEKASAGIYPQSIVNQIAPERLHKYFIPKDGNYQVIRQLREMLIFSPHDLTRDTGFTRMHFISCRNVLIYMQSELQQQIIRNFHFSLLVKGILFLGESESVAIFAPEFDPLDRRWKIYQKRRDVRLPFPIKPIARITANSPLSSFKPQIPAKTQSIQEHSLQRILTESNTVILLVSPDKRLLHVYGDCSKIFKPLHGEIVTEVTRMVVLPLQLPLNTALHKAKQENKSIIYNSIQLEHTDSHYIINLKVIPPESDGKTGDFYLVQIHQEKIAPSLEVTQVEQEQFEISDEAQQHIFELEHELEHTRENLQALIEELETTNEEQQASNEELTASNEELRTVNIEYQSKIRELTQLNNDIDNLLKSTEIGVIFLDEQLKIRKFTPAATEAVSLRYTDVERPLTELTLKIECPQLLGLLESVIENPQFIELEVKLKDHDSYLLMRIHPYQTEEQQNEGIVISFVKIDEIKTVQLQLENTLTELTSKETEINNFFQLSLEMLCVANLNGYFRRINPSFARILGYSPEELLSVPFINFVHPDDVEATLEEVEKLAEGYDTVGFENRYRCQDGSYRWFKWMASAHQGLIYAIAHDLTEQKLALELQNRQLAAIETAGDGIAILNDDRFIYLNQAHLEIFGYSQPEELIGQSWRVLYEPEQLAQLEQEIFPILLKQGRWQGETTAKHRDGHRFDEELTLTFTPKGDLICVCRDITEIKQARQQILQTNVELEQRVTERTQTLADLSVRLRQLHRLATNNYERLEDLFDDYIKTGCQMLNLDTGTIIKTIDNIRSVLAVHSSLNFSEAFNANFKDTYCAEIIVNAEVFGTLNFSDSISRERELKSHEREIVELMARDIGHAIATWQSKEALQKSEQRFRSTFEQAAVGVAHISPDGRFIKVNQRLCNIVGYDSDRLLELKFQEITHPDDLSSDLEYVRQMLAGTISTYSMEKRYIRSNGSIVWITLTVSLVKNGLGEPEYFISVIEDISDRKQTEIALEESRTELKQANQAKDAFIAHMSHELRTPLNSILGFSSILQKDTRLTPQQLNSINIVHQSGQHLLTLINDILDLSKITAQKLQLEPQKFHLRQFLNDISTIFSLRAQQKGLEFSLQISPSVPVFVGADETRLRQVLLNLLSNAVKFTETGSVTLTVSNLSDCEAISESHLIRFQVEDTGIGIPTDKFTDIFAPFGQLNSNAGNHAGTGLGLTISHNIVQLMSGQIQVESQVSQGSKFWFDLKLSELNEVLSPKLSKSSSQPLQTLQSLNVPCKILVVDDNENNRALLSNYLQPLGFIVAEANNGEDGLATAKTFQPDAILVDLVMPVMDGAEMITKIKQQPDLKDTVMIMISANSQLIPKSSEINCHGFLSKPVNLKQLLELLESNLQLEWQLNETLTETENLSNSIVAPPQEELSKLLELVDLGDMEAVEAAIKFLEASESQYNLFVQQVRQLAKNFQQNQLEVFIKSFMSDI